MRVRMRPRAGVVPQVTPPAHGRSLARTGSRAARRTSAAASSGFSGSETFFRPGYVANLTISWIPALDGVADKLAAGGRAADVGCGHGASTVLVAQAYPKARVLARTTTRHPSTSPVSEPPRRGAAVRRGLLRRPPFGRIPQSRP